ncbi:hypothetical protein [Legionella quateirensis]|uniref:Uncharacterized protein n=1 Tax=Legionella quateirensis TaxID=45072 RepID=A0A378KRN3_9GAMM|nr:hypothetical protein [Legionella quateirensis]KTD53024.1 hypothetical protein Lqua_0857 [Legionella quateirensis]STY17245.1 Uncharacterised protein [Legionella quateirensis]
MDNYTPKSTSLIRLFALLSLLIGALVFVTPARADSRELNAPVPKVIPTQVSWYIYYGYRPYRYYYPYRYYNSYRYYYPYRYYRPYRYYYRW